MLLVNFAHAFGQRYELPLPLLLFVLGGAGVVFLSFLLVLRRKVKPQPAAKAVDEMPVDGLRWLPAVLSFVVLGLLIACGAAGSQTVSENILPTLFWLVVWIALPVSCGIVGDWTRPLNPFANIAKLMNGQRVRKALLGRSQPLGWPVRLGWWPAAILFFIIACGELIYNQTATKPAVTATGLLMYFVLSAFMGLVYGKVWLQKGEVFSVLFATWGRLGYLRFGATGKRGFAGGLVGPFDASPSRIAFTLLLLISVSFDGLISTPFWTGFQHGLPGSFTPGSLADELLSTAIFLALALAIWLVFMGFAAAVKRVGERKEGYTAALAGLLPSLLPISFGYLLAHNIEYLVVNSQLLFPLIGNPTGKASWPLHLPHPFNDSFEPHIHLLPSSFYWYFSVVIIVAVHIVAVVLAHRHLGGAAKNRRRARRSEYPWVVAMVAYTMLSLWLLAQPLVKEKPAEATSYIPAHAQTVYIKLQAH